MCISDCFLRDLVGVQQHPKTTSPLTFRANRQCDCVFALATTGAHPRGPIPLPTSNLSQGLLVQFTIVFTDHKEGPLLGLNVQSPRNLQHPLQEGYGTGHGCKHSARFNSWLPYLLLLKSRFYSERRDTERGLPFTGSLPK